jgi:two-component system sensor kinase FixL
MDQTVSDAHLRAVLKTAVDGVIVIDSKAKILLFNEACENLFGYDAGDMIGQNVNILMPPDIARSHDGYLENYLKTGERHIIGYGRQVTAKHKDGTLFPVELSVGEASTPEGKHFIGIVKDLRPRRRAEKRIQQLQAQLVHMTRVSTLDEMGAALAHELNQPLTALKLYLQALGQHLLQIKNDKSEELQQLLDKARDQASRTSAIIQRMRQYSEKREPMREKLDLGNVLQDALDLVLLGYPDSQVTIHNPVGRRQHWIEADPVQIQQVFVNIMRNALEALEGCDAPSIMITVSESPGTLHIHIQDSGPGITPSKVKTLFQGFSSDKKSGMGLGLAISRGILQNHGGDLGVEPGGKGVGARFTVEIPKFFE